MEIHLDLMLHSKTRNHKSPVKFMVAEARRRKADGMRGASETCNKENGGAAAAASRLRDQIGGLIEGEGDFK